MSGKSILKNVRQSQLKRLLLPLVFVAVMLFLFLWLPILPALRPVEIDETTPLSASVNEDRIYVRLTAHDLYYSGCDYYENGTLRGHYYYNLNDGYCRFYILAPSFGKPADTYIEAQEVIGRLEKISSGTDPVVTNLAILLNWDAASLQAVCDSYAVNVAVYLSIPEIILFSLVTVSLGAGFVLFLYYFLLFLFPRLTPTLKRLKNYGNAADILNDAEEELDKRRIFRQGNMALTTKYLFDFDADASFIIPLHDVLWVFPLQDMHYSAAAKREKMIYSLRIVTIVGDTFMLKNKRKEDIDTVMEVLTDRYPNFFYGYSEEHDKMVNYILEENKREQKNLKKSGR